MTIRSLFPLLVSIVIISSCFSAPLGTLSPPPSSTLEGEEQPTGSVTFSDLEDVMMDPTAKMPWQKQEGDITYLTDKFLFPEDPDDPFFERPTTDSVQRSKRAAVKNRYKLWINGVVPFVISDAYTESERRTIIKAMDHWETHTCIRFVPRTTQRDYISFFPGWGCYSYVGRAGGNQGISVGRRCLTVPVTMHEIGHTIGYYHEQSRPDRDEHVQIIRENIEDDAESEFQRYTEDRVDSYGVGYDYNSIMHYDAAQFSQNGEPTIIALDPDIVVGQARELSALDIEQTKRLYRCPATPPPRSTIAPEDDNSTRGPNFPSQLPYPECGGFFTNLSGTIESPGFPEYPHNMDCGWFFKMPLSGFQIIFEFEPFEVEASSGCESDYVEMYESLDTSGETWGKKCGKQYGKYQYWVTARTSYAYLHFHTNGTNETPNLKGFRLHYHAIDNDECYHEWKYCSHGCSNFEGGFECSCPDGFFMSSDGRQCFDVNECGLDKGGCDHKCINRAGSYRCACAEGYTLQSDNRTCIAEAEADPCSVNNGGCEHICTVSDNVRVCSCQPGYSLASDGTSCVENIDLCSSNGGKGDCEHNCTSTPGSRVCSCPTGFKLLSDGVSCEDINECDVNNGGCQQLHCINLEGSFRCGCRDGFKLREDSNGCAEILQGPSGTISSANWPETYPINVNLQWVIQCESNQRVDLTFSRGFGIAGALPSCPKDWLKVYDGDSTSSNLIGKFCHYALPQVPRSSSNSSLVHFYAGPSHNPARKGFEVTYSCVNFEPPTTPAAVSTEVPTQSPRCGKTLFTENSGRIDSPNWPATYPTNVRCEYYIQLQHESSRMEISFNDGFGIAGSYPSCPKDWIKIYSGHTTDDLALHGTYCQWQTPPVITTSGSKAKIVLYAGPSHNPSRRGFSANYHTI